MKQLQRVSLAILSMSVALFAHESTGAEVKLITLDPGHFHASLVQKFMYPHVSPTVHVYAPDGEDLKGHLARIEDFNHRPENPTHWDEQVYRGADFLDRMVKERAGNVVVISGNNLRKTEYLERAVNAGFNVLADKPMAVNPEGFKLLCKAFDESAQKRTLLYDIMTERFEITSILQRELARMPSVFGKLQSGSEAQPAVEMESVHYFAKEVAGKPLIRPAWFFDVHQEGEAIQDVGTHLVDIAQWQCFPDQALDWRKDIKVSRARRWPTKLTAAQFKRVTGADGFPDFLRKDVAAGGALNVFANGEVIYTLRGVHVKVTARWEFESAPGAKDTHSSVLSGTKANLLIKQGPDQRYVPTLYIQRRSKTGSEYENALREAIHKISQHYPGTELKKSDDLWEVVIPEKFQVGHEEHFAQVTGKFLQYLADGKLPAWEIPNMLAKYYTTTEAYRMSR